LSTTNLLRVGIILTVTGILALAHSLLTSNGILPRGVALVVGVVLVAVGVPVLIVVARCRRSDS
jgi:uncharacterized membrane protein